MTLDWTPLPWDSEFFGFGVGKVDLDGVDFAEVAAMEADARRQGVTCLYGSHDAHDARSSYLLQEVGYRFVEAATLFSLALTEPPIPKPEGVDVRLATEDDLEGIDDMVTALAPWSRYAGDPRFGLDAALRMQRAWAVRAVTDPKGDFSLTLAEDETGPIAFITRARHPDPVVDGVGTTARGSGAARYLIEDARAWAGDEPLYGGPIAARNVPALRYVSYCGYRVFRVRYLYHRWLDE